MGHGVIIYGVIIGASYKVGEQFDLLQKRNEEIIRSLPKDDDWPWVDCSIFALPGPYPVGTYRRQVIHIGLSIKDDPQDPEWLDVGLRKFEEVLKKLYWSSVRLHIETDSAPRCEYLWVPTEESKKLLYDDAPSPVANWIRSIAELPGEKLPGTW